MLTATAILLDGLVYASWLFIVALGLTLIFGVMKILNVAHGGFYAFGAYCTASAIGLYFQAGWPAAGSFLVIGLVAILAGLLMGLILERGLIRFMYGRDEVLIVLVTFASFLIIEDVILLIWGGSPYFAFQPHAHLGVVDVAGLLFATYDLVLIGLAVFLGLASSWALYKTSLGKILLAVIHDREMSAAFGINVSAVFTITFVIGAILGALGGAVTAPMISVSLGIGVEVIVLAFAIVVIGGMGSVMGAAIGAVIVGLARAAAVHLLPEVELFVIYAVMAIVLAFRPEGLFTRVRMRRI